MQVTVKNKAGSVHEKVTLTDHSNKVKQTLHELGVAMEGPNFSSPTASVGFSASLTRNLGNYSSAKVEVSLYFPSLPSQVDTTMDQVQAWVNERMETLLKEMDEK